MPWLAMASSCPSCPLSDPQMSPLGWPLPLLPACAGSGRPTSAEWLTADIGWWQSEQAASEVAPSVATSGRPFEGPWRDPVGEGAAPRDLLHRLPAPAVCVHTVCCLPLSSGFSVPSRCL